jgi:hypothetical protein
MLKQNSISKISFFLIGIALLTACGVKPSLGFNTDLWKSDKDGCKLERLKLYRILMDNQEELLDMNTRQIVKLLGVPERNQLYKRNQKFFIYNISPSGQCDTVYDGTPLYLFIHFNAVGVSQEIFIQEEPGFSE